MGKPKLVTGLNIAQYHVMHKRNRYDNDNMKESDLYRLYGLVIGTGAKTVLDYGSGTGKQYTERHKNRVFHVKDENMYCFDPAVAKHNQIEFEEYDGVICNDVLEHIPEGVELDTALHNIFILATKFVFIAVFCGLAQNILLNGKNAHCTIKKPTEWESIINKANFKNIPLIITYKIPTDAKEQA